MLTACGFSPSAGGSLIMTHIFGFELSDDEMKQIKALNRDEKHDWY